MSNWFPDPLDPSRHRYWRGDHWSDEISPGDGQVYSDQLMAPAQQAAPALVMKPDPTAAAPTADDRVGLAVPAPGWWAPFVIAALSGAFLFLPWASFNGQSSYLFRTDGGSPDWGSMWPFLAGIGVLVAGGIAAKAGRVGLSAIAAGAALYVGTVVLLAGSFFFDLLFEDVPGFTIGIGVVCALAAAVVAVGYAWSVVILSFRIRPRTTPVGWSIVVAAAAAVIAAIFVDHLSESPGPFWTESAWTNVLFVLFLAINVLNIVLPLARSNSPALGLVGGFTSLYAIEYVVATSSGGVSVLVSDSSLGGLAVVTVAGGGCLLALVYERVLVHADGMRVDIPERSMPLVLGAGALALALACVWGIAQTNNGRSSSGWAGSCAGVSSCRYGDDYYLDGLWDSCAGGNGYACDDLYYDSPVGSEYEHFGAQCGHMTPAYSCGDTHGY